MWIESHTTLKYHPKTQKAARLLGISIPQTIGHLHCLWWWCAEYVLDGDLTPYADDEIADAAMWEGDPGVLIDGLSGCGVGGKPGFIEDMDGRRMVHDWHEFIGKLLERREKDKRRKADVRGKADGNPVDVLRTSDGRLADGARTVPTVPTVPTEKIKHIASTTPEEERVLRLIAPYTMTPKEIASLLSTFTVTDDEVVAAMSHPNARKIKSPYLYLRNWFKRSAVASKPSEFKSAVSRMFDQFAANWPNRDCLGEARSVFLDLFPEAESRQKGRDRAKAINAHAKAYLERTETRYVMRLSRWLKTTDFTLSSETRQEAEYEVNGDARDGA